MSLSPQAIAQASARHRRLAGPVRALVVAAAAALVATPVSLFLLPA